MLYTHRQTKLNFGTIKANREGGVLKIDLKNKML